VASTSDVERMPMTRAHPSAKMTAPLKMIKKMNPRTGTAMRDERAS
jgi:hypothetical protein